MDELLPIIPHGASEIAGSLSVVFENERWIYFHGGLPVFSHMASDIRAFKMISSMFINDGICRNKDIQRVFGVSKRSIIRNCKKYREKGTDAFYPRNKKKD